MRLQDRNMIGGAGVSLQKNGASGILFQFVKDLIKYYKFKYIGHDIRFLIWAYSKVFLLR